MIHEEPEILSVRNLVNPFELQSKKVKIEPEQPEEKNNFAMFMDNLKSQAQEPSSNHSSARFAETIQT